LTLRDLIATALPLDLWAVEHGYRKLQPKIVDVLS
jgi:hypothetical protein